MKKITTILLIAFTFNCYSQKKYDLNAVLEKEHQDRVTKADSLFVVKEYQEALNTYNAAMRSGRGDETLRAKRDTCMRYYNIWKIESVRIEIAKDAKKKLEDKNVRIAKAKYDDSVRVSNMSPEDKAYYILNTEMSPLSRHGKLTQFNGIDYNFVSSRIQSYMRDYMNCSLMNDNLTGKNMVLDFQESVAISRKPKKMKFNFTVYPEGNFFTIKRCIITGDYSLLLNFYIKYWTTTLNVDTNKTGVIAETKLITDIAYFMKGVNGYYIEVKKFQ